MSKLLKVRYQGKKKFGPSVHKGGGFGNYHFFLFMKYSSFMECQFITSNHNIWSHATLFIKNHIPSFKLSNYNLWYILFWIFQNEIWLISLKYKFWKNLGMLSKTLKNVRIIDEFKGIEGLIVTLLLKTYPKITLSKIKLKI